MLKIKNAVLAASCVKKAQYPPELPLIALFGRSNAGKSSLINTLINRKNLARTSSAPGKTRLLNFYRIEAESVEEGRPAQSLTWYFVDLPGYGYAKAAKSERAAWLRMMEVFMQGSSPRQCWQLVDIRHRPSAQDELMHQWLCEQDCPPLVVANKVDKVSRNARAAGLRLIADTLQPETPPLPFSALTREGRDALLQQTEAFLLSLAQANIQL